MISSTTHPCLLHIPPILEFLSQPGTWENGHCEVNDQSIDGMDSCNLSSSWIFLLDTSYASLHEIHRRLPEPKQNRKWASKQSEWKRNLQEYKIVTNHAILAARNATCSFMSSGAGSRGIHYCRNRFSDVINWTLLNCGKEAEGRGCAPEPGFWV